MGIEFGPQMGQWFQPLMILVYEALVKVKMHFYTLLRHMGE
jgi:hypothetical protein